MRMPWGQFDRVAQMFLYDKQVLVLGCLSFEDRCVGVPALCTGVGLDVVDTRLIRVIDPPDGIPNYTAEIDRKTRKNESSLRRKGVIFRRLEEG